jgi:DNA-binding NtrC family response regulator
MRDLLERLVGEMVDKGIHYEDAQREFERRFIARVLQSHDGNLGATAKTLGVHRNTLTRKIHELKLGPALRAGRTAAR